MKLYLPLLIASLTIIPGCRSPKATISTNERNISTSRRTVILPDTIPVTLPSQSVSIITTDSVSFLSNDYAESTVHLRSDGTLHHSLVSHDVTVDIPVAIQTEICDTVVSVSSQSQSEAKDTSTGWWKVVAALALLTAIVVTFRR